MTFPTTLAALRRSVVNGPCSALGVGARLSLVTACLLTTVTAVSAARLPEAGDRGYGISVFKGRETERFKVEILGSIEGFGSTGTTILARLSGAGLEHTGVLQGMSGSPVYVDGELIGAVMSTWSFAKDPIAGIRPIDEMRAIGEDVDAMAEARVGAAIPEESGVVWSASGFSPDALEDMKSRMSIAVTAAAAGGKGEVFEGGSLEGGDPMAVMLVDGDARLFATGTVTERIGDTVIGFGHPFMSAGRVSLPMAQAEIVALMPSQEISFKIARAGAVVGALRLDGRAGISGVLGERADTLPVRVWVAGGDHAAPSEYAFEVGRLRGMTPQLVGWAVQSAVADRRSLADGQAYRLKVVTRVEGHDNIVSESAFAGAGAGGRVASEAALPLGLLENVLGERPRVAGVEIHVAIEPAAELASITRLQVADPLLVPGETLRARVELKSAGREARWETIELELPQVLAPGTYRLHVTDGATAFSEEIARTAPRWTRLGLEEVRAAFELRGRGDTLVAVLYGPSQSLIVDGVELHALPPRARSVLGRQYAAPSSPASLATPYARSERALDQVAAGAVHLLLRTEQAPKAVAPSSTNGQNETGSSNNGGRRH